MSILSLVTDFADNLLKLQEEFSAQNRFDVLEKEAVKFVRSTIAKFLTQTLSENDAMIRNSGIRGQDYTIVRQTLGSDPFKEGVTRKDRKR